MARRTRTVSLHNFFKRQSRLRDDVKQGCRAIKTTDRNLIQPAVRTSISESIDLDEAMRGDYPHDSRWDYLIFESANGSIFALEPHSARDDQVDVVVRKKQAACSQLLSHTDEISAIQKWLWVSGGSAKISKGDKRMRKLNKAGITYIGRQLKKMHLE